MLAACAPNCDSNSVRRPIWRSQGYRDAIAEYKTATVVPSETDKDGTRIWNRPLDSPVKATVTGRPDAIQVSYPDEPKSRFAHSLQDYTTVREVRVKGPRLYIYRAATLMWIENRLAVYDLANRKLLADWLVAPEDMPSRTEIR
jgi:hypothetical protein